MPLAPKLACSSVPYGGADIRCRVKNGALRPATLNCFRKEQRPRPG
jgi:hypothetical protein